MVPAPQTSCVSVGLRAGGQKDCAGAQGTTNVCCEPGEGCVCPCTHSLLSLTAPEEGTWLSLLEELTAPAGQGGPDHGHTQYLAEVSAKHKIKPQREGKQERLCTRMGSLKSCAQGSQLLPADQMQETLKRCLGSCRPQTHRAPAGPS